jgi:hypothetical protein
MYIGVREGVCYLVGCRTRELTDSTTAREVYIRKNSAFNAGNVSGKQTCRAAINSDDQQSVTEKREVHFTRLLSISCELGTLGDLFLCVVGEQPSLCRLQVRHLVGAGWVLASVLSLPQMGVFGVNVVGNRTLCESKFRERPLQERQAYLTFINVVVFMLPTIIMLTCYVRIFTKIASKAAEANEEDVSSLPTSPSKPSPTFCHRRISSRNSNDRSSSSVTRKVCARTSPRTSNCEIVSDRRHASSFA